MLISRKFSMLLIGLLLLTVSGELFATPREEAIKSGFIYNFARYSQGKWFNASHQHNYNICSFNLDFVVTATKTLLHMKVESRPVNLILLTKDNVDLTSCNTLFISKADTDIWNTMEEKQHFPNMMLVGEFDGFLASGGHINFFIVSGKIRFEVAPKRLRKSGIKMSSKVLRLGRVYEERAQ
ncbi:YfiR family protein [Psychromonas sp. B3M02]|uniref:YfiR family protein n=1 Tax=Psychromonas sp. B3M02 TaxID=2267226 RepID=UPI000DE97C17|nr:YfiR family protein [Psychromonas sp. B3M02]RBW47731.1 YfiR family protein [Psychromonas sp. B3M02]